MHNIFQESMILNFVFHNIKLDLNQFGSIARSIVVSIEYFWYIFSGL
jgi:hypothetical protein